MPSSETNISPSGVAIHDRNNMQLADSACNFQYMQGKLCRKSHKSNLRTIKCRVLVNDAAFLAAEMKEKILVADPSEQLNFYH